MSMRKIYRQIAKKYGVSVQEVKQEMQAAINEAYQGSTDEITTAYQQQVPRKGEIPTQEELIRYISKEVKNQIK